MSNPINLFCFPFAGGSKYSYRGFEKVCPPHLKLIPVEIAGRGARFLEPLKTDMAGIIDDLFHQLKPRLNEPYAFYGHSMGALIGYLLTKRILEEGYPAPLHLFFTGRRAPSVPEVSKERPYFLLPKNDFIAKIKELGGSPDDVLEDEKLMEFFEPILRADFQAIETHQYKETEPFDIPVYVVIGTNERITYEEASMWQKETTQKVEVRQFPGKHFFIFGYEAEIMRIILKKLTNQLVKI